MRRLSTWLIAPRLIFAARLLGAVSAAANLLLGGVCLCLLPRGDWLGLALGLALLLPSVAWFLALRGPLPGARAFAVAFLAVWTLWTVNDMLPCVPGECGVHGFLVVALPNLAGLSTPSLLICAFLFYTAHRLQSRPERQQLSSS